MFGKPTKPYKIYPWLLERMVKKGMSNKRSTYRVVCAAFNHHNELLGITVNGYRRENLTPGKYTGYHCEMKALHRWGNSVAKIVLMRLGNTGDVLPIDCCPKCEAVLRKCGIRVEKVR